MGIDAIPTPLDDFILGFYVFLFNGLMLNGRALDQSRLDTIRQLFSNLQGQETSATGGKSHHTLDQQLLLGGFDSFRAGFAAVPRKPGFEARSRSGVSENRSELCRFMRIAGGVATTRSPETGLSPLSAQATEQIVDNDVHRVITPNVETKEEKEQKRPFGLGLSHLVLDHHAHHRPQTGAEFLVGHLEHPTIFLDERRNHRLGQQRLDGLLFDRRHLRQHGRIQARRGPMRKLHQIVRRPSLDGHQGRPTRNIEGKRHRSRISDINSYCKSRE